MLTGNIHPIASACNAPATVPRPFGRWRRHRGLMSAAHRCRGAVKCEHGTATAFLRPQPSSLPDHPYLSLLPPLRPPPRFLSLPVAVVDLPARLPARSLPPRNGSHALNLMTRTSQNDVCATPRSSGYLATHSVVSLRPH